LQELAQPCKDVVQSGEVERPYGRIVNRVRGLVVLGIVREVSLVLHQLDRRRGAGVPQDRWTAQPARSRTTGARQSSGLGLASGLCGPAGTSLTWLPRPRVRDLSQKVHARRKAQRYGSRAGQFATRVTSMGS